MVDEIMGDGIMGDGLIGDGTYLGVFVQYSSRC